MAEQWTTDEDDKLVAAITRHRAENDGKVNQRGLAADLDGKKRFFGRTKSGIYVRIRELTRQGGWFQSAPMGRLA